jgi:hypothetical protein
MGKGKKEQTGTKVDNTISVFFSSVIFCKSISPSFTIDVLSISLPSRV